MRALSFLALFLLLGGCAPSPSPSTPSGSPVAAVSPVASASPTSSASLEGEDNIVKFLTDLDAMLDTIVDEKSLEETKPKLRTRMKRYASWYRTQGKAMKPPSPAMLEEIKKAGDHHRQVLEKVGAKVPSFEKYYETEFHKEFRELIPRQKSKLPDE